MDSTKFCEEIYNAGFESINVNQANIEEIKYKLDSSVVQLFDKVKINLTEPISNQLLKNQIQSLENLENNQALESDNEQNENRMKKVKRTRKMLSLMKLILLIHPKALLKLPK